MFTAAFFLIAQTTNSPEAFQQMKKQIGVHPHMEQGSATKKRINYWYSNTGEIFRELGCVKKANLKMFHYSMTPFISHH